MTRASDPNHPYVEWNPPEVLDERRQVLSDLIDDVIAGRTSGEDAGQFCREMVRRS